MKTYSAKKVDVIVNGEFIVGFMDGTFVTVGRNSDFGTPHIGAKGEVSYSDNADDSGTIVVTLKQDSASLASLQRLARNRALFEASVFDGNTNFRAGGAQCRILTNPGREFADTIQGVEITIYVGDYTDNQ